jgi:hypothetical protein
MIIRIFFFMLIAGLSVSQSSAQSIFTGSIKNKSGQSIIGTVTIQDKDCLTISGFSQSDAKGEFEISYAGKADSVTITISGMTIGKHSKTITNKSQRVDFVIQEQAIQLKEVTVKSAAIKQSGDTLNYLVGAYANQNDRVIGDVIRKMPGIEVAEDGKISFNGKEINKFYVENLDLLHGRYGIATNNIPMKAVSVVQVLENHQPIKALREKITTDDVAINLKLKDSAKGALSIMGMLGGGYQPTLWNAEFTGMYFGKKRQNMTVYKGNNSGDDVASEFRTHYDYERVYMDPSSPLRIQMPTTPSVPRKRYIDNRSHAITTNHLIKPSDNSELTTSILYHDDRIKKEGYSYYEQFLPADVQKLIIEEQISSTNHIHNAEVASRFKINKTDYYLNNSFNLKGSWNNDLGVGNTWNNVNQSHTQVSQHLDQPFFSIDNTLNLIKTISDNSYTIYFSAGYSQKPHTLTISPVSYLEERELETLMQDLTSRDFGSVLRLSYGLKIKNFKLDYALWGRADIRHLETMLYGEPQTTLFDRAFQNDLWYNTYQAGLSQRYSYEQGNFRATLGMPFIYYALLNKDKIPDTHQTYQRLNFQPSLSLKYEYRDFIFYASGSTGRNFGDMNTGYTGYIMHGYRSLLRNTADRLLETRSVNTNTSIDYRNALSALFINLGVNYGYSWKNLLYGYNYQGVMSIKNTIVQPTDMENYGVRLTASKGLDFWRSTLRVYGNYNEGNSQQLIQNEVLNSRFRSYGAGAGLNVTPISFISLNYSFSWGESQSYMVGRSSDFPKIRQTSQTINLDIFPTKAITINMNVEHQYNRAASQRYTTFADASMKWKNQKIDIELGVNNIFNAKQYVSASYSEISTYYYSYSLRPVSALLKIRFKIK